MSEDVVDITHSLFTDQVRRNGQNDPKRNSLESREMLDLALESDVEADGDEAFIAAHQTAVNRKVAMLKGKKGGGFQAMGLSTHLLKAITKKGYAVPTPIQRKTIPLVVDGQDVVGMARTGSGKTAAFVIPMIEKLKAHSVRIGARALILSPSRELAIQTLKVVKDFARDTDLICVLLVGGDSLEDQFGFMTTNPDVVIATPGRFLHLKVEMSLDLSTVHYVVFDEADRLFEMGFAAQLSEIIHALPTSRQTLLFSATLPKSLVEFARAGLQDPHLVRLDTESKVSPDLENAFFGVKSGEKEGALLHILSGLINMPTGAQAAVEAAVEAPTRAIKKRKRVLHGLDSCRKPSDYSTIIFAATKHHVEYLTSIVRLSGFAVSHAYGSLDQTARNSQIEKFRAGMTNILVVTDVAARGIDIPILANVINYDFPPQPKIFVHRVGRTARAGRRGWSYSLIQDTDVPYLLDLQLFLGKALLVGRQDGRTPRYAMDMVVGALQRDVVENATEFINKLLAGDDELKVLRKVAGKGEKLYVRTRNSASNESAKRSKEILASVSWSQLHPLFDVNASEQARIDMLARVSSFRPEETVFELGTRGKYVNGAVTDIIKSRRARLKSKREMIYEPSTTDAADSLAQETLSFTDGDNGMEVTVIGSGSSVDMNEAFDGDHEVTVSRSMQNGKDRTSSFQDLENFLSYIPKTINSAEERGYGVHSGSYNTASHNSNFLEAARGVTMDLTNDNGSKSFAEPSRAKAMRWDKKNSKFVVRANDEDGSKGKKMIRGESGQKIAASFQSGRFDRWRKANKVCRLARPGETEHQRAAIGSGIRGGTATRYKHKQEWAPKEADRFRDDYYVRKRRVDEAKLKRVGRFKEGTGKSEIKSTGDIHKEKRMAVRRKAKITRPSRKK